MKENVSREDIVRMEKDITERPRKKLKMEQTHIEEEKAMHREGVSDCEDTHNEHVDEEEEVEGENDGQFVQWMLEQRANNVLAIKILDMLGFCGTDSQMDNDELWNVMLSMGTRLLQLQAQRIPQRAKLQHVNTIEDVIGLLQKCTNIVVLTGAGISVSCGIPDFRSENGIYSRLQEYNLPNPQCMFGKNEFSLLWQTRKHALKIVLMVNL